MATVVIYGKVQQMVEWKSTQKMMRVTTRLNKIYDTKSLILSHFQINNGFQWQKQWQAISDTGTSFIGVPKAALDKIAEFYEGEYNDKYGAYTVDCARAKSLPDFILQIGSEDYRIKAVNLVARATPEDCEIAFFEMEGGGFGPSWILGDPFIRQFCNVHDVKQKRIGFAPSRQSLKIID